MPSGDEPDFVAFAEDVLFVAGADGAGDGDGFGGWGGAVSFEGEEFGLGVDYVGVCAVDGVELVAIPELLATTVGKEVCGGWGVYVESTSQGILTKASPLATDTKRQLWL